MSYLWVSEMEGVSQCLAVVGSALGTINEEHNL